MRSKNLSRWTDNIDQSKNKLQENMKFLKRTSQRKNNKSLNASRKVILECEPTNDIKKEADKKTATQPAQSKEFPKEWLCRN